MTNNSKPTKDQQTQAAILALLLIIAEQGLAFRALRDTLHDRGVFEEGDEAVINQLATNKDALQIAYAHFDNIFQDKFSKTLEALLFPEEVTRKVEGED